MSRPQPLATPANIHDHVWSAQTLMQRTWTQPVSGEEKVAVGEQMEAMASEFLARIRFRIPPDQILQAKALFETHVRYDEHAVSLDLRASRAAWRSALHPNRAWMLKHAAALLPPRGQGTTLLSRFKTIVALKARVLLSAEARQHADDLVFDLQVGYAAQVGRQNVLSAWASTDVVVALSQEAQQALHHEVSPNPALAAAPGNLINSGEGSAMISPDAVNATNSNPPKPSKGSKP